MRLLLSLFVEFLLLKQEHQSHSKPQKKTQFLAGIDPVDIPVSTHVVQRDEIYENRIQYYNFR